MNIKPIFGVRQTKALRLSVLEQIVKATTGDTVSVLEVGSYEGASALHWSRCIAEHKLGGSVMCVDPWKPYPAALEQMNADLEAGVVFSRFKTNIGFADAKAPISYFVGRLSDLVSHEYVFDVVFIDGDHTHKAVLEDLRLGAAYLRDGGILCGDDLDKGYPGVVSAVGEFFGEVWSRNAIFAMRKQGGWWVAI